MIAVGTRVAFEFTLPRVSLADAPQRRSGVGIVIGEDTVGTSAAYAIRVEESPHYNPGAVVSVITYNTKVTR